MPEFEVARPGVFVAPLGPVDEAIPVALNEGSNGGGELDKFASILTAVIVVDDFLAKNSPQMYKEK